MKTVKLICHCGKEFRRERAKVQEDKVYTCSKECRRALTQRADGTFRCARCMEWLDGSHFKQFVDPRYTGGVRRSCYCQDCALINLAEYRKTHKKEMRRQHNSWRERCLAAGGDTALRWYFNRHLGSYRSRSKRDGLPFDLDAEFLLHLFHVQDGKCYYTGVILSWNAFGTKSSSPDSMSLDRLTPQKGYTRGNVVLCSMRANAAKGNLQEDSFYEFCKGILAVREQRANSTRPSTKGLVA